MAKEPESLTVRLLQEIREAQSQHGVKLDVQAAKLDQLVKEVEELRSWTVHALGVVTTHHIKNQEQDARLDALERRKD